MQALLTAIVLWLSVNYDLPANYEHPNVKFVPPQSIGELHYGDFLTGQRPGGNSAHQPAVSTEQLRNVIAVYSSETRTIYLPVGWTGDSPAELSILVHEMVHHLQHMAGLKYECAQEREKVAFFAQERWLRMFGSGLSEAFGIDPFTLLVRTNCAY